MAIINGSESDETLAGTSEDDAISGNGGNDILTGASGDDAIDGGAGNDTLAGDGIFTFTQTSDNLGPNGSATPDGDMDVSGNYRAENPVEFIIATGAMGTIRSAKLKIVATDIDPDVAANGGEDEQVEILVNGNLVGLLNLSFHSANGKSFTLFDVDPSFLDPNGDNVITARVVNTTNPADWSFQINSGSLEIETSGNDTLEGRAGSDTLEGGDGNDILNGGTENDILRGNGDNDTLNGDEHDDMLTGGTGHDRLEGGAGNDTIEGDETTATLSYTTTSDNQNNSLTGTSDGDMDVTGTGFNEANPVEFEIAATFTGAVQSLSLSITATDIDVAGGGLAAEVVKVYLNGHFVGNLNTGPNNAVLTTVFTNIDPAWLVQGANNLVQVFNANTSGTYGMQVNSGTIDIVPLGGDDVIDGGAGEDTMRGGAGNDTYFVDAAGDTVTELAGEGTDTVRTAIGDKNAPAFALYYIPANVENLVATSNAGQGVGGNALNNVVTAGSGADLIAMHQGGVDNVNAGAGADYIWFGDTLTGDDVVNGGLGRDTLAILGPYANLSLGANVTNIERLELFSSGGALTYNITLADSVNSPHPNFFEVVALSLTSSEHLNFDGSSDTDSRYFLRGGAGNDTLRAGAGNDRIVGNDGNDSLFGNAGNDILIGGNGQDTYDTGAGSDTIEVLSAAQSTSTTYDIIAAGFDPSVDRINVSGTFAGWGAAQTGALNQASFDADLAAAVDGALGNGQAVKFTVTAGDQSGKTFLVYDANGDGSYTAGTDYVFEYAGPPANLESHAIFV